MPHARLLPFLLALVVGGLALSPIHADDASVQRHLQAAWNAAPDALADHAAKAAADPDFRFDKLSDHLHALDVTTGTDSRKATLEIEVGFGHGRRVHLRLPKNYDPSRPWPLLYSLHASGSSASSILRQVENLLGKERDRFILAAPHHYRQTSIDAPPPFTPEHPVMIRAIKEAVHVDSDRVFSIGYSLGGYTSWTLGVLHADLLAGAVPMAGCPAPLDVAGLWEAIGPNFQHMPILSVWGERDRLSVPAFEGRIPSIGSMSDMNRQFQPIIQRLGLNVIDHPIPRAGHGGARPDDKVLRDFLERERVHYPKEVRHRFRHLHQASAYWLEGHEWQGPHWDSIGARVNKRRGEKWPEAYGRVYLPLLGRLDGKIDGQTLRVTSDHLSDLTVWIGDGMIDWAKPVKIVHNGVKVFEGELMRDVGVAVAQAKRTRDLDRIRLAGVRLGKNGKATIVTPEMDFPPLIRRR